MPYPAILNALKIPVSGSGSGRLPTFNQFVSVYRYMW